MEEVRAGPREGAPPIYVALSAAGRSLGAGAILVVLAAMAATLTLILPAVLALLGDRIN